MKVWLGRFFALLGVVWLCIGCGGGSQEQIPYTTLYYEVDSTQNKYNPDRGLYDAEYILNQRSDYDRFQAAYRVGFRLVYGSIHLEEYATTELLPQTLLDTVALSLKEATDSGVKVILRILYRDSLEGEDPSKAIILSHLEQFAPIFENYEGVISVVQAGLIGAWGEWHSFTGEFSEESDSAYLANRKEVVEALAKVLPHKFIQIRTPMHKEALWGAYHEYGDTTDVAKITPEIAYSDDIRARIGHHNDYFLSSQTDMGTYESSDVLFWKVYVQNDSSFAPSGGESGTLPEGEDAHLTDCDNTLKELRFLEYSFLNGVSNESVIEKWKTQGCYETIAEDIGYKFVVEKLQYYVMDDTLFIKLSLRNDGYAAAFNNYSMTLALYDDEDVGYYPLSVDIRSIKPEETKEIEAELPLSSLGYGSYCLDLKIGDAAYPVHLANKIEWNSEYESNRLLCDIFYEDENQSTETE